MRIHCSMLARCGDCQQVLLANNAFCILIGGKIASQQPRHTARSFVTLIHVQIVRGFPMECRKGSDQNVGNCLKTVDTVTQKPAEIVHYCDESK